MMSAIGRNQARLLMTCIHHESLDGIKVIYVLTGFYCNCNSLKQPTDLNSTSYSIKINPVTAPAALLLHNYIFIVIVVTSQ